MESTFESDNTLEVEGISVHDHILVEGFENPLYQPCVVVYARIDTDLVFIYLYTSRSWLSLNSALRFANRVTEVGRINPIHWEFRGVIRV